MADMDALIQQQVETGNVIKGDEDRKAIVDYLTEEISDVFGGKERGDMEKRWSKWRRQREARPEQEAKSFPWEGASNAAVPLAMYNTQGIFALLKASIGAKRPFWVAESIDRRDARTAEGLTNLLGALAESRYHLNVRNANNTILYEVGSMGTQFVEIPWVVDKWYFKRSGAGSVETVEKVARDTPVITPITMEDFGTRSHWYDIQRAPWVAKRAWLYEHELKQRAAQGIYFADSVEKVLGRTPDEIPEAKLEQMRRMGLDPDTRKTKSYAIFQTHVYWDTDGDGIPEDIKVWLDLVTGEILRAEYNELGIRNIVRVPYVDRPGQLYGIGVGWMLEHLQDEIDALHNMRVDGSMLSMLQMYVTRRGGPIAPDEEFRPLKNIQVDNPAQDFIPIKFPDIGYTTIQAELMAKEYADRVTGAADAMMGYESRSTSARTTAAGTMFLAQQGNKMFGAIKETCEEAYAEMGQIVTYQLVANRDRAEALLGLIPEDQAELVRQVLSMNVEDIPARFRFRVQTADVEQSNEARRQSKLTLVQLYTMYGQQVFQMLPMIYNPQVPPQIREVAQKFFIGATNLMEDIFVSFGEKDTDEYLPYVRDIEMMTQAIEAMKDQSLQGGQRGRAPQVAAGRVATQGPEGPYGGTAGPGAGLVPQGAAPGAAGPAEAGGGTP